MTWYRCSGFEESSGAWQPYSLERDLWNGILSKSTNSTFAFSDYTDYLYSPKSFIVFEMHTASGYEGRCFTFPSYYNLVEGTNYNLKFDFTAPSGITISGSYNWGCKWSNTEITNFNTSTTVNFQRIVGDVQSVVMPFTASSSNYFSIILSALSANSGIFYVTDIEIEEAT